MVCGFLEPQQRKLHLALLITAAVCATPLHGGNAVDVFFSLGEGEAELCTSLAAISAVLVIPPRLCGVSLHCHVCFRSPTQTSQQTMFFLVFQAFFLFLVFI